MEIFAEFILADLARNREFHFQKTSSQNSWIERKEAFLLSRDDQERYEVSSVNSC